MVEAGLVGHFMKLLEITGSSRLQVTVVEKLQELLGREGGQHRRSMVKEGLVEVVRGVARGSEGGVRSMHKAAVRLLRGLEGGEQ